MEPVRPRMVNKVLTAEPWITGRLFGYASIPSGTAGPANHRSIRAPDNEGRTALKLYMHPVSMTCRPVRLFAADNNIVMDEEFVDLMTGAHMQPPYSTINPNCLVPLLEDGDLNLTESSAILKYLADKIGSPAYPKDLKQRDRRRKGNRQGNP